MTLTEFFYQNESNKYELTIDRYEKDVCYATLSNGIIKQQVKIKGWLMMFSDMPESHALIPETKEDADARHEYIMKSIDDWMKNLPGNTRKFVLDGAQAIEENNFERWMKDSPFVIEPKLSAIEDEDM